MNTHLTSRLDSKVASYVIDVDVHESLLSVRDLLPYLDRVWHPYLLENIASVPPRHAYVVPHGGTRKDAKRADGTTGGQHLEQIQEQLLDAHGIGYAMLTGEFGHKLNTMPQQQFAAGLASAYNDWALATLITKEPRLKGAIAVAAQLPNAAAREIDRLGGHPGMVQVMLPIGSPDVAWGDEKFYPIWEASIRNNLVVGFHVAPPTALTGQLTGAGWPKSYMEARSAYPNIFQAQLISLVCNGVFAKFPDLRVAFIEGGFAWVPFVMWRLDQSWSALRAEVPWLTRRPSAYIREQVRLGTQPFEEPDDPDQLLSLIDMMGSEDMLMFSTDYPHWDFDSPVNALPAVIKGDLRQKILYRNAMNFYQLPLPDHQAKVPF
jgi:predicted TIM-barrel fold metal-dependent hydrolase